MQRPTVDVVVPFLGSAKALAQLRGRLASLSLQPGDSVIVVDNSASFQPPPPGEVPVIHAGGRPTPAFARNAGAAAGDAEWLVFCDADTVVPADLLDRYFDPPPGERTGLIGGGVADEPVARDAGVVARYSHLRGVMSQEQTFDFGDRWGYPKTANVACRRAAFEQVGGFREEIRAAEDADLTYRLRDAGWEVERRENAAVVHSSRTTLRGLVAQQALWGAGGAWVASIYPGSVPLVGKTGLWRWALSTTLGGFAKAIRTRDRDAAIMAVMRPVEALAWEYGRRRKSNLASAPMSPRVSLLMPNRDNAPVLDLVLERLAVNSRYDDLELVVVDDGSTDGSREILRRWRDSGRFPEFKLIEREPSGVIETLNAGLAQATGELIVQLDGDASVETPGWVQKMVDLMDVDPRVGVVTGKIVFDWGEVHTCGVDVVGPDGFHDRGAEILEPQGRRTYHQRVLRRREGDCPACDEPAEVDAGIGCCMMYRREAALELGGYDPGWAPVWFDDLDLTMGMRRLGLKCFYLPGVHVTHHVGHRVGRRRLSAALPARTRKRVSQRLNMDRPPKEQWDRIQHHYGYWREKWGWDMLNPDMDAVLERWGNTEVCWRYDEARRAAGREILAR